MWTKMCVKDIYQLLFMLAKITKKKEEGGRKEERKGGSREIR